MKKLLTTLSMSLLFALPAQAVSAKPVKPVETPMSIQASALTASRSQADWLKDSIDSVAAGKEYIEKAVSLLDSAGSDIEDAELYLVFQYIRTALYLEFTGMIELDMVSGNVTETNVEERINSLNEVLGYLDSGLTLYKSGIWDKSTTIDSLRSVADSMNIF